MLSLPPSSWKNSCVRPWRGIFIFGTSHGHNGEKDINGVYNKISNLTTKKLQIETNLFMQTNLILSEIEIVNGCQMFEMYKITLKTLLSYFLALLSRSAWLVQHFRSIQQLSHSSQGSKSFIGLKEVFMKYGDGCRLI